MNASHPSKAPYSTIDGQIGVITMNHGKVNALSKVLLDDIVIALDALEARDVEPGS